MTKNIFFFCVEILVFNKWVKFSGVSSFCPLPDSVIVGYNSSINADSKKVSGLNIVLLT